MMAARTAKILYKLLLIAFVRLLSWFISLEFLLGRYNEFDLLLISIDVKEGDSEVILCQNNP